MTPPRTGLLSRLWNSLAGSAPPEPEAAVPPLFPRRPVPPPEPRGPGLPSMDEILLEAPPPPDPERMPRLTLVPEAPAPQDVLPEPEPAPPPRPLTTAEQVLLLRIRALIAAGRAEAAQPLLDEHFRDALDVLDRHGVPVYLIESYRCCVAREQIAEGAELATALRRLLPPEDPVLEAIIARHAVRTGNAGLARAAWQAVLVRDPGFGEALDWLACNTLSPDGGVPAGAPAAPAAMPDSVPDTVPNGAPAMWLRGTAIRLIDGMPAAGAPWDSARALPEGCAPGVAAVLGNPAETGRAQMFTEAALTLFALTQTGPAPLPLVRLYAGRQPWATRPAGTPQAALLAALFPGVHVVGPFEGAVREDLVLALEGAAREATSGTLSGGLAALLPGAATQARARVFAACGVDPAATRPAGRKLQALYLPATPALALAPAVLARLAAMLESRGYEITGCDLAALPWHEQVQTVADADLIFGVHSGVMSSVLWANRNARVLELFPAGVRRYDTQVLAEAAGVAYFGVEAIEAGGHLVRNYDRPVPPTGHAGGIVSALPWSLIEAVFATAEAA